MTHSWLITGPPGSGRSNLAYAFAAALIARPGDEAATEAQVQARTHPDLGVLSTDRVIITIDEVRQLVAVEPVLAVGRPLPRHGHRRRRPHDRAHLQRAAQGARRAAAAHRLDPLRAQRGRPDPDHPLARAHACGCACPSVDEVAELIARRDGVEPARRDPRRARGAVATSAWRTASRRTTRRATGARRTLELALGIRSVSRRGARRGRAGRGRRRRRQGDHRGARRRGARRARCARSASSRAARSRRRCARSSRRSKTTRSGAPPAACATGSTASWSTCCRCTATSCCCSSASSTEPVNLAIYRRARRGRGRQATPPAPSRPWTRSPPPATASRATSRRRSRSRRCSITAVRQTTGQHRDRPSTPRPQPHGPSRSPWPRSRWPSRLRMLSGCVVAGSCRRQARRRPRPRPARRSTPTCSRSTRRCSVWTQLRRRHAVHRRRGADELGRPGAGRASSSRWCGSRRPGTSRARCWSTPAARAARATTSSSTASTTRRATRLQAELRHRRLRPARRRPVDAGHLLRRPDVPRRVQLRHRCPASTASRRVDRRRSTAANKEFGDACLEVHRPAAAVRRHRQRRPRPRPAARGARRQKLNYLGYSYGTFLGATYADLYPEKTGRLVLDGALDPATDRLRGDRDPGEGLRERAARLPRRLRHAVATCPFDGTSTTAMAQIGELLDRSTPARSAPATAGSSDVNAMFTAIILPALQPGQLAVPRPAVRRGDARATPTTRSCSPTATTAATPTAPTPTTRPRRSSSINCLDYQYTSDPAVVQKQNADLVAAAPVFGPWWRYGGTSCDGWPQSPHPASRSRRRAPPTSVVGTTNDPATPYVWAQALAGAAVERAPDHLHGEGHTAYNKSTPA